MPITVKLRTVRSAKNWSREHSVIAAIEGDTSEHMACVGYACILCFDRVYGNTGRQFE